MVKVIFAVLLLLSAPAFAATTAYSSVIDDLPLMQGMVEKTDDAVVFDNPGGRIVETTLEGAASAAEVKNFYGETLPSLGWTAAGKGYVRGDESLALDVDSAGGKTAAHFTLTPKGTGG